MALKYMLGDFMTGNIIRTEPLPVRRGGEVSLDILGDSDGVDLYVNLRDLTKEERADWRGTFHPTLRFIALIDDEAEHDEEGAVLFAGWINKVAAPIRDNLRLQVVGGLNEYLKSRLVADVWGDTMTDPTRARVFSADTWAGVLASMVSDCFSTNGIPADAPTPPNILGTTPSVTGDAKKKAVKITDALTYFEAMTEVKEGESGNGMEWRWVPRWASSTMNRVVFDLRTGNPEAPHIGASKSYNLPLSASSSAKLSGFSTVLDSNGMFSKLYIQSRRGDEEAKEGADFRGAAIRRSDYPLLLERFYNPGVELTSSQLSEQLSARIAEAARVPSDIAFTLEEEGDPATWLPRLGGMLYVSADPEEEAALGHEAVVRIVGMSFTPGRGTMSLDVMTPQTSYPRLPTPKSKVGDLVTNHGFNSNSLNQGMGGFSSIGDGGGDGGDGGGDGGDGGGDGGDGGGDGGDGGGDGGDGDWGWGSGGAPADGSEPPVVGELDLNLTTNIPLTPLEWFKGAQNEGNIIFHGTSPSGNVSREEGQAWPTLSVANEIRTGVLDSGAVGYWQPSANKATVNEITIPAMENRARTSMGQAAEGKWLKSVSIDFAPVISVAGWVLAPFHATLQFSPNSGESGTTETWSRVLFLRAQYISYSQIGAFSLDPITEVREPWWSLNWRAGRKSVVRAGSWLLFGQSNNAVAANFTSGGVLDNLTGWSSWPTGLAPKGEFAVAVRPNGGGYALYTSGEVSQGPAQWFPLLGTTLMVEGEQPGENLTEATPGNHYATPFTMYGRVYYRVHGAGFSANGLYEPGASGGLELVQEFNWPSRTAYGADSWTHWNHAYIGPGNPGRSGGVDNRYHTLHFIPTVIS